jgi:hypothetical protein
MTITVDIEPEVEAELARQAALCGRPVEARPHCYLKRLSIFRPRILFQSPKIWWNSSLRCAASISILIVTETQAGISNCEAILS